jgi:hypothetical protein
VNELIEAIRAIDPTIRAELRGDSLIVSSGNATAPYQVTADDVGLCGARPLASHVVRLIALDRRIAQRATTG